MTSRRAVQAASEKIMTIMKMVLIMMTMITMMIIKVCGKYGYDE